MESNCTIAFDTDIAASREVLILWLLHFTCTTNDLPDGDACDGDAFNDEDEGEGEGEGEDDDEDEDEDEEEDDDVAERGCDFIFTEA